MNSKLFFVVAVFILLAPPLLSAQETGGVLFEDLEALYNQTNGFQDNFTLPAPTPIVNETTNETTYPIVLTGPFYTDVGQTMQLCDFSQDFITYDGRLAFNLSSCLERNIQNEKESYNLSLAYLSQQLNQSQHDNEILKQMSSPTLAGVIGTLGSAVVWGIVGLIAVGVYAYTQRRNPGKIKEWRDALINRQKPQEVTIQPSSRAPVIPVSRTNKYGGLREKK